MTDLRMTEGKSRKNTTRKRAAGVARPANSAGDSARREPDDDEIRLRAYFIAESRLRAALPGDPDNDWIEARRQLLDEARND